MAGRSPMGWEVFNISGSEFGTVFLPSGRSSGVSLGRADTSGQVNSSKLKNPGIFLLV
jgi:hypothetical protein